MQIGRAESYHVQRIINIQKLQIEEVVGIETWSSVTLFNTKLARISLDEPVQTGWR